jgi:hypothetical protein
MGAQHWDVAEEARLEELGRDAGRPRRPDETVSAYATSLAEVVGDEQLVERGAAVDRHRYAAASVAGPLVGPGADAASARPEGPPERVV